MKKILLTSLLTLSALSIKAQTVSYENVFFNNLYGKITEGNANEQPNYHLSNTQTGFGGDWGLDVKWWGGVKLRSALGLVYLTRDGNVGIGTEAPGEKLEINGNLRIKNSDYSNNNNTNYTFLMLGKEANDQFIADNTAEKIFGGGYFFRVHNESRPQKYIDAMSITENGNVGIGINIPQNKLEVAGTSSFTGNMKVNAKIEAREVKVTQSPTADFVFEEDYILPTLEDVEKHIKKKKHLPEIASAKEMEKEGVNVGEFQIKLLQKIEELTLYSIEQNKQIKTQSEKIKQLELENEQIKSLLDRVEKLENSKTKQP